jgi:two-component system nitrogen regulation response regulator GlnG
MNVLIVDDDDSFCLAMSKALRRKGWQVQTIQQGLEALSEIPKLNADDLVILDLNLPDIDGLSILRQTMHRRCQVLMLTGHGGVPQAVEAMRAGAYSFLTKPVDADEIDPILWQMYQLRQKEKFSQPIKPQDSSTQTDIVYTYPMIGKSEYTEHLRQLIQKLSGIDECILLTGEKGTGKELVAKALHEQSLKRKNEKCLSINMACLPMHMIESELFGHVKGATPSAIQDKDGLFKECGKGTLFLDEISELPLEAQAILLRVLESNHFKAVGDNRSQVFEGRLILATHKNLQQEVQAGRFREDLYEFLQVVPLHLSALRERKKDILPIFEYWFYKLTQAQPILSDVLKNYLENYQWPGNVRELVNLVKRISIFHPQGGEIALNEIVQLLEAQPFNLQHLPTISPTDTSLDQFSTTHEQNHNRDKDKDAIQIGQEISLEDLERAHIENLINKYHNLTQVAKILGVNRRTLQRKLKIWGSHMADLQDEDEN